MSAREWVAVFIDAKMLAKYFGIGYGAGFGLATMLMLLHYVWGVDFNWLCR